MSDKLTPAEEKQLRAEAHEKVIMRLAISAFVCAQTKVLEGKIFDDNYKDVADSVENDFEDTF